MLGTVSDNEAVRGKEVEIFTKKKKDIFTKSEGGKVANRVMGEMLRTLVDEKFYAIGVFELVTVGSGFFSSCCSY